MLTFTWNHNYMMLYNHTVITVFLPPKSEDNDANYSLPRISLGQQWMTIFSKGLYLIKVVIVVYWWFPMVTGNGTNPSCCSGLSTRAPLVVVNSTLFDAVGSNTICSWLADLNDLHHTFNQSWSNPEPYLPYFFYSSTGLIPNKIKSHFLLSCPVSPRIQARTQFSLSG